LLDSFAAAQKILDDEKKAGEYKGDESEDEEDED